MGLNQIFAILRILHRLKWISKKKGGGWNGGDAKIRDSLASPIQAV